MKHSYPMLTRYVIPDMPSADELLPYLRQIDGNRWYSNFGPLVTQFEERLTLHLSSLAGNAAHTDPISLLAVTSCYHALQTGLQLFRLPPDAQVLVPAVTFPACPLAIRHAGAKPVLADIDADTWQLTPQTARQAATRIPVHAVMPVALYGVPVPVEAWDKFTEETGIPVIIDAAAALETQIIPCKTLVACSLHATKPFSVGEGGLLISRDRAGIEEARSISNFGMQQRITLRNGVNAKMSEYHGAVSLAQLDRWEGIKERRRIIFALYRRFIKAVGLDLVFQTGIEGGIVSTLMLRAGQSCATSLVNALNGQGIAAHRMYLPPLYHHPYFTELAIVNGEGKSLSGTATAAEKAGLMKNSEDIHQSVFGLPFHTFLDERDIAHVVTTLVELMDMPLTKIA